MTPKRTASAATVPWGPGAGQRLAEARSAHSHDQTQCIDALIQLGARRVTQPTLAKWESGGVKKLDEETARAIDRYREESGLDITAQMERSLTGEPLLSERQARLIDGFAATLVQRGMTDAEIRFAESLLTSVGL